MIFLAPIALLLFLVAVAVLFGVPLWLLLGRGGAARKVVGGVWLAAALAGATWVVVCFRASERSLQETGRITDGREYCLVRDVDLGDYAVSLWVRNGDGIWCRRDSDFRPTPWTWKRPLHVEFENGRARVFRGRDIVLDTDVPDRNERPNFSAPPAYEADGGIVVPGFAPASVTPDQLAFHSWAGAFPFSSDEISAT